MKKLVTTMALAAGVLWLAPGALAGAPVNYTPGALAGAAVKYTSTLILDRADYTSDNPSMIFLAGHVESESKKCLANRTVKITDQYGPTPPQPFDTAKTSKHGGFSGIGAAERHGSPSGLLVYKLLPRSVGTTKHPKTCLGATVNAGD